VVRAEEGVEASIALVAGVVIAARVGELGKQSGRPRHRERPPHFHMLEESEVFEVATARGRRGRLPELQHRFDEIV